MNLGRVLLVIGLLMTSAVHAQEYNSARMIKLVTRETSPGVPNSGFSAKPKTLYRLGETYARLEEVLDSDRNLHGLIIISEPLMWIINLWDKTGRLVIDTGPTHVFHAPIIPPTGPNQRPPLRDFEYGREYEFLSSHHAKTSKVSLEGKQYDKTELSLESYSISLFSYPGEKRPYRVTIVKDNKIVFQTDYDYYNRDLDPQMFLFAPPTDIRITTQ